MPGELVSVLGDMDYQAANLSRQEYLESNVAGSLVNRRALPPNIRIRGFRLMTLLFMSLLVLVAGLVVVRLRSSLVEAAAWRAVRTPWRSLGKGLMVAVAPLVGCGGDVDGGGVASAVHMGSVVDRWRPLSDHCSGRVATGVACLPHSGGGGNGTGAE